MKALKASPLLLSFFLIAFSLGFSLKAEDSESKSISFMTFNVENLFDSVHDEGKEDFAYLPRKLKRSDEFLDSKVGREFLDSCVSARFKRWRLNCLSFDWSEDMVKQKLEKVAGVLRSVNEGRGADVVLLQEVENLRVLKMLVDGYLKDLNYTPVLIEGQDERGIDTAILTRFPVIKKQLHSIDFKKVSDDRQADTRGILQVTLEGPDKTPIEAFSVHFPAPFHPTKMRVQALETLNKITSDLHSKAIVLVGGDFNITSEEEKKTGIVSRFSKKNWYVSHLVGCKKCPGTSYYSPKKDWSFLDQIWVSKELRKHSWQLNHDSIRVVTDAPSQSLKKPFLRPKRTSIDMGKLDGVSDHWPIYLELSPL